jgi:ABC-type glycerol-3-phosphate transport system substrate-binding protein
MIKNNRIKMFYIFFSSFFLVFSCFSSSLLADTTLSVSTNIVGNSADVLEKIAKQFEKENPGIKIELSRPGKDYEKVMKIKMAAGDLPDVFSTHGWAVIRYGDFLLDLSYSAHLI